MISRWMVPIALLALLAAMPSPSQAAAAAGDKPNVIFILADDLGWTDVGSYGSTYNETPNIDRLAAQGMRFTSAYTCGPNCAPTRAALMSGQYGPRTGIYTVGGVNRFDWSARPLRPVDNVNNLPLDKFILPQAMKEAGYATAMFGKWHLGNAGPQHPGKRGFDEAIEANNRHFDFETDPAVEVPKGQYLADFLTDKAVDFIKRKKDGPFFLYLPHFGVHGPYQAKPELIAKFKGKAPAGNHHDPVYAAMLYSVDESVGRVMATLDELKIADNTLIIFSSDNGGVGGYVREGIKKAGKKPEVTDNAPLRSGKGSLYEGGTRVPFVARFPGKIKPGSTTDEPIATVDLYPTFLDAAGAKPKSGYTLDGVSVMPVLTGAASTLGRDALYWHFPGYLGIQDDWRTTPAGAIRSGDYKLVEFFETGKLELYNLKDDLSQKNDLSAKDPAKTKALHEKLTAWRQSINAPMPAKNDPAAAAANEGAKKKRKARQNAEDEEQR